MPNLRQLLSRCEFPAYQGIVKFCEARGELVLVKIKLSDVVDHEGTWLEDSDFAYFTRAHVDFVIAHALTARLLIECDFIAKDRRGQWDADRKDRLCSDLGVPLIRMDCRGLLAEDMAVVMQAVLTELENSVPDVDSQFEMNDINNQCLLHSNSCDLLKCSEFQSTANRLFTFENLKDCDEALSAPAIVRIQSSYAEDGYITSKVILQSSNMERTIGSGRCRCSRTMQHFGKRLSRFIALWSASRGFEETRRHLQPLEQQSFVYPAHSGLTIS